VKEVGTQCHTEGAKSHTVGTRSYGTLLARNPRRKISRGGAERSTQRRGGFNLCVRCVKLCDRCEKQEAFHAEARMEERKERGVLIC